MNKNEELINTFYNAFARHDYRTMQKCYNEQAQFSDPVFPLLQGKKLFAMWHMLCEAGKDLVVEYSGVGAYDNSARASWKAVYTFGKTGRIVHNNIEATFVIKDSLIISHRDNFNFWNWSKMAIGLNGQLLGWSDYFKETVREKAEKQLLWFIKSHPEYGDL